VAAAAPRHLVVLAGALLLAAPAAPAWGQARAIRPPAAARAPLDAEAAAALARERAETVRRLQGYRASLEGLLPLYAADVTHAAQRLEERRARHRAGEASEAEVDEALRAHEAARATHAELGERLAEAERLVAEALALQTLAAGPPADGSLIAGEGRAGWSLAQAAAIQRFFQQRFGRPLPLSAFGQTPLHTRLAFDHGDAMDVALHPDSPEGRVLIAHLRATSTPFLAFRSRVPGAATGAHIHIGRPSGPLRVEGGLGGPPRVR
jgi:hypothetical protein